MFLKKHGTSPAAQAQQVEEAVKGNCVRAPCHDHTRHPHSLTKNPERRPLCLLLQPSLPPVLLPCHRPLQDQHLQPLTPAAISCQPSPCATHHHHHQPPPFVIHHHFLSQSTPTATNSSQPPTLVNHHHLLLSLPTPPPINASPGSARPGSAPPALIRCAACPPRIWGGWARH